MSAMSKVVAIAQRRTSVLKAKDMGSNVSELTCLFDNTGTDLSVV